VAAWVPSILLVWVMFVPDAYPWKAVLAVSVAFSIAFWLGRSSIRPAAHLIHDVEAARTGPVSAEGRKP
jgi:hypothetical protein